jgi:hypothetical protein
VRQLDARREEDVSALGQRLDTLQACHLGVAEAVSRDRCRLSC